MDLDARKGEYFWREISGDKIINYDEKFETEVVQSAWMCEKNGEKHALRRVLPLSIKGETTTEVKSSEGKMKVVVIFLICWNLSQRRST